MKQITEKKDIFITTKYLLKFTFFLLKEKIVRLKQLQEQFIEYRDSHIEIEQKLPSIARDSKIKIKSKSKKLTFPILVLFDAENMPIQEHYRLIKNIVIEEFGQKSWDNAKLETAYQESTEYFNNRGYNQDIKTHYVSHGENKADDKLIEIAKEHKIPHVIIVTNDKELISRLQDVTSKYTSGKLFVYNGDFLKEYTLSAKQIELSRLKELKMKREKLIKECEIIDMEIANMDRKKEGIKDVPKVISISRNLEEAKLDENIKNDLIRNPLFINFTEQLAQVVAPTKKEALTQSHKVLKIFIELPRIKNLLETKGLNINIFKIGLRYAIRDFNQSNYGDSSFVKFIEYVAKNSDVKLVLKGTSEYKLFFKDTPINELEMSEVLEKNRYNIKDNLLSENFGNSFADLMKGYNKVG